MTECVGSFEEGGLLSFVSRESHGEQHAFPPVTILYLLPSLPPSKNCVQNTPQYPFLLIGRKNFLHTSYICIADHLLHGFFVSPLLVRDGVVAILRCDVAHLQRTPRTYRLPESLNTIDILLYVHVQYQGIFTEVMKCVMGAFFFFQRRIASVKKQC